MTVSPPSKARSENQLGEIFVGLVWLALYAVMILTGLWHDAGPLLAAINRTGLY